MANDKLKPGVECRGASDEDTKRKAEAQSGAMNELPCLGGAGAGCCFMCLMFFERRCEVLYWKVNLSFWKEGESCKDFTRDKQDAKHL